MTPQELQASEPDLLKSYTAEALCAYYLALGQSALALSFYASACESINRALAYATGLQGTP